MLLTIFICMQEIWANQSMNIWLKAWKYRKKHLNDPNALIEHSNTMDDVYENVDVYNSSRKRKKLTVFDDMIADIMTNRRFLAIIK